MKKLFLTLGVSFAFVVGLHFVNPHSSEVSAHTGMPKDKDHGNFLLPSGQFTVTSQGSLGVCINPATFTEESCGTAGALVIPETELYAGVTAVDKEGTSCVTFTTTDTTFPVGAVPPTVISNAHCVGKILNYDSTIGAGDGSYTVFIGGQCNGATFDSAGATETKTGNFHFVVSDGGNRSDFIITSLTDQVGGVAGFSFSGTYLRQ
jgi:hypothetical protein